MSEREHLSPAEFDAFMKERFMKRLQNKREEEKGFVVGSYLDIYFSDNKLVACAMCGIPLFVRPWVLEIGRQNSFPIFCQFCVPPQLLKGTVVQDLAAAIQHTEGER